MEKLKDAAVRKHGSKMRNQPVFIGGFRFASKKEGARYRELVMAQKAGLIRDLKVHPVYKLEVQGWLICRYIADFDYYDQKKECIVVEDVKGRRSGVPYQMFRLKASLLYALTGLKVVEI